MSEQAKDLGLLTPEQLTAIEADAGRALAGPWTVKLATWYRLKTGASRLVVNVYSAEDLTAPDGRRVEAVVPDTKHFVAASISDVPDLCRTVRQAWTERDALRTALALLLDCPECGGRGRHQRLVFTSESGRGAECDCRKKARELLDKLTKEGEVG